MTVKLSGTLPKEHDRNGMDVIHHHLVQNPQRRHVVVMVVDSPTMKTDHYGDEEVFTPTAGVLFIEPITDREDRDTVLEVLARHRAERTGDATLDFDFGVEDPLAETIRTMRDQGIEVTVTKSDGEES